MDDAIGYWSVTVVDKTGRREDGMGLVGGEFSAPRGIRRGNKWEKRSRNIKEYPKEDVTQANPLRR